MKTKLLQATRMVAYVRNFETLVRSQRYYSSKIAPQGAITTTITEENKAEPRIPEREVYLLGPKDLRAPLPGDVGVGQSYMTQSIFNPKDVSHKNVKHVTDLLEGNLPEDRQKSILEQFLSEEEAEMSVLFPSPNHCLELTAQICPWLVKGDLSSLFPDRNLLFEDLTVVTMCHKTLNDMSHWDENTDVEREQLTEQFIMAANQICDALKEIGYWADFIDPTSGRPYLGAYTNSTFFETDERYRHFGLKIEDLGCCKVVSHPIWGTNTFVGCIFTNAPLNSEQIVALAKKIGAQ